MYMPTVWDLIGVSQKTASNDNFKLADVFMVLPDRGNKTLEEFLQTCMRARAAVDNCRKQIESTDVPD